MIDPEDVPSGDEINYVKNTIVGILNTDEQYHHEMAEFCLELLDLYVERNNAKVHTK